METRFIEGRDREVCPSCGFIFYRNPVPAVAVVVEHDGGIVLVRRRYEPRAGLWALPAGFMELGETTEETGIRECYEETGLVVAIEGLLGVYSFSDRPGTSGIVIIYAAKTVEGQLKPGDDAAEVAVFPPDQLPDAWAFRTHQQALERWRAERRRRALAHTALLERQSLIVRLARAADEREAMGLLPPLAIEKERLSAGARFHDRLHNPDAPILVVEAGGAVVGMLALSFRQTLLGWEAWIDHLHVTAGRRRQGIGQALVEGATMLARERGARALVTIPADNEEGWHFLRACGFTIAQVAVLPLDQAGGGAE